MNQERRDFFFPLNKPASGDTLTPVWKIPQLVLSLEQQQNSPFRCNVSLWELWCAVWLRTNQESENSFVNQEQTEQSFNKTQRSKHLNMKSSRGYVPM